MLETSIEKMSNALAHNGTVRTACRLALAKWDAFKEEKTDKLVEKLMGAMKDL